MAKARRRSKRTAILVIGTVLGLGYFFFDPYEAPQESIQSPKHGEEEADYYGSNVTFKQYAPDGRLQQSLTSQSTEHFPLAQLSTFVAPIARAANAQGEIWQIQSDFGEIKDREERVTFQHNVQLQPLNPAPQQHLLLETELLHYHTEKQLASSDQAVKITSNNTIITGIGFEFLVANELLTIKQQVKTHHVPPSQP